MNTDSTVAPSARRIAHLRVPSSLLLSETIVGDASEKVEANVSLVFEGSVFISEN
jgi:hypothetical protein